ncbi:alpha/beta hydrolase, partial [Amycolatopsis rhizosphaerae]
MANPFVRSARFLGRLVLALAAVAGLAALFLVLIVLTDGAASGIAAWLVTVAAGVAVAIRRVRGRAWPRKLVPLLPVVVVAALTASVCIPDAPTDRRYPPSLPFVATQQWSLATGSRVAVYHYPPGPEGTRHATPLVYLHGGPVRGISVLDHQFLQLLAGKGYDVYAFEHAGGGRSELLPMEEYGISRSVRDLEAFIDHLDKGPVDVLGFSSGAVVLTRELAEPNAATRVHRAIIAEPGPMDGPTAGIAGQQGRPSARGLAPPM